MSQTHYDYNDAAGLGRFLKAQETTYAEALAEIKNGQKRRHWMWFIFPQLAGLGFSPNARLFAIHNIGEAKLYLAHPVLGRRLRKCCAALLGVEGRSASEIFGTPDDLKLRSCATLFAIAAPSEPVFDRVLEKYYGGVRDARTEELLRL